MMDESEDNFNYKRKKQNKFDPKAKDKKINKIKLYYEEMNKDPEKVKKYIEKKTIEILSITDKSRFEIEDKIYKNINKNIHENLVSETLDFFEKNGYINDERFVENYIRMKYESEYGKSRIVNELKQKNINSLLIEEKIEEYDFDKSLSEYIERRHEEDYSLSIKEVDKITRKLIGRGFDYSSIKNNIKNKILKESNNEFSNIDIKKNKADRLDFISKRVRKSYGINKIKSEGFQSGLKFEPSDFEEFDFFEIVREYRVKKYGNDACQDKKEKNKRVNHLLGRGFTFEEIKECGL